MGGPEERTSDLSISEAPSLSPEVLVVLEGLVGLLILHLAASVLFLYHCTKMNRR